MVVVQICEQFVTMTQVVPNEEKLKERECEEEEESEEDVQWQGEVADCEAEYETFVGEDIASNVGRDEGEGSQKRSSNASATSPAKLFEAPALSLMKASHAPKKTFIRCIDLMVASKKKNQLSKLNGRSKVSSGGRSSSHRRLDSLLMDDCELAKDRQPDPPSNEGKLVPPKLTEHSQEVHWRVHIINRVDVRKFVLYLSKEVCVHYFIYLDRI